MKYLAPIMLIILLAGCSSENPVATPPHNDSLVLDEITSANILGAYELTIDVDSMTADLIPKRQSAIGESWIVSGRSYFDTQPCRDCFRISGIGYEDDRIVLKFAIRHPFEKGDNDELPTGRNRLDLDIFDLAMVVAPQPLDAVHYTLTDIAVPIDVIDNPDGYTNELAALTTPNVALPYRIIYADSMGTPSSNMYNKFEMGASGSMEVKFHVTPGQTLVFDLYLTFGYGFSAVLEDRLRPKYFNPEFNRKAAWKVEVIPPHGDDEPELGNTWDDSDDTTEYNVTVKVYDWQIGANVNPDLEERTDVYASSEVDRVSVEIPGMTNESVTVSGDSYLPGGTGMPDSPLIYHIPIRNENNLTYGEYTALVAVYDERSPLDVAAGRDYLIHTPDAGKNLDEYEIPDYVTYQTFTATVVEYIEPTGNLIWVKEVPGAYPYAITALPDGSTVTTGGLVRTAIFGAGEPTETELIPVGDEDIFIARYNPDGTFQWAKRAGGSRWDYSFGITSLSDDSTVATGRFEDTATFGEGEPNETELVSDGSTDIFIARYNPDGTLAWAKRAGGPSHCRGRGVSVLSDDSIILTGYFNASITIAPGEPEEVQLTSADSEDIFIARFNSDGTLQWAVRAGGSDVDYAYAVTALSDDSIVITGNFGDTAIFGEDEPNETELTAVDVTDIYIARYNPNGTLQWAKRAGGLRRDESFAITALSDDSTVITGRFAGSATFGPGESNETELSSDGETDLFIARYNPDGTLAWVKHPKSDNWDMANSITTLSDDSVVVTGYFTETVVFGEGEPGETELTSAGSDDIFFARYSPDGTLIWAKRAGGSSGDIGHAITALWDDTIVAAGDFTGPAIFGEGEPNETLLLGRDMFIARFQR